MLKEEARKIVSESLNINLVSERAARGEGLHHAAESFNYSAIQDVQLLWKIHNLPPDSELDEADRINVLAADRLSKREVASYTFKPFEAKLKAMFKKQYEDNKAAMDAMRSPILPE